MTTADSETATRLRSRAETVRKAREALLVGQDQLAEAAGVSVSTVARLERGRQVSAESLKAICAVLQINAVDLNASPQPRRTASGESAGCPDTAPSNDAPVPSSATLPVPMAGALRRLATRLAAIAALSVAAHVLCLVAADIAVQTSRVALAPDRRAYQDGLLASAILNGAREVNEATAMYSSTLPPDAPERGWEPWRKSKPFTWLTCGSVATLGESLLTTVGIQPEAGDNCQERNVPLRMTRRDPRQTDFLLGPLPRRDIETFVGHLTGDPTVRVMASVTPLGDMPPDGAAWFDPRRQAALPREGDGSRQFAHIRLSSETR